MNVDKIKGSNWKDILLMVFVFLLSLIVAVPVIKLGTDMFGYDAEHAKFVVPVLAGFFSLGITNFISILKSYIQNELEIRNNILMQQIELKQNQSRFFMNLSKTF